MAEAETDLFPLQLLHRTNKVEAQLKRRRLAPNGPRTIDIDILLFSNFVVDAESLVIRIRVFASVVSCWHRWPICAASA